MALVYNEQTGNFDDVQVPPIIRSFLIEESEPFYQGDSITLSWNIDGANHIILNEEEQSDSNLTINLREAGQHSFTLKTTNSDGISERTITVDVLDCPQFNVNASSVILREGLNERVIFSWSVKHALKLKLRHNDTVEDLPLEGELSFCPTSDTQYDFEAEGLEGHRLFHHMIPIKVRKAAQIKFKASRLFSYPNLPITLIWDVENAFSVSLDNYGEIRSKGILEVTPGIDTTYSLRVKDEFGEEQKDITIKMLPLPAISNLFVPIPKIEENLAISYTPPKFEAIIPVPTFESSLVKLDVPQIPNLRISSYFAQPISKRKKRRYKNPFKTLYSYFFSK